VLIGTGLAAVAAMVVWALTAPAKRDAQAPAAEAGTVDDPAPAAAEPARTAPEAPSAAAPAKPAEPAPAAPLPMVDLFAGGAMPDFMSEAYNDVKQKTWLDASRQKALYDFGRAHRDDARPQLLLAWDAMNREWRGIAVRMYAIAYRADHRAKDDPSMLTDLLTVASMYDTVEYREASALVRDAYGAQALPRIDDAIATYSAQGDTKRVDRLKRLRVDVTTPR
jgi:hypothetical protein